MQSCLKTGITALLLFATAVVSGDKTSWCGPNGCPPASALQASHPLTDLPKEVSTALQSIARVRHASPQGASLGTASLIAHRNEKSYFITCAHLFDDGQGVTTVLFAGETPLRTNLLKLDRQHDLALLETNRVQQIPITVESQIEDRPLVAAGFGSRGKLRATQGNVTGYATPVGARLPSIRIRGAVRPGDSGGPVLNLAGELVAVVWGERGGETYATFGEPLRRILSKLPKPSTIPKIQPRQPNLIPVWSSNNPTIPNLSKPNDVVPNPTYPLVVPSTPLPTPAAPLAVQEPQSEDPSIEESKANVVDRLMTTWQAGQFALGALSVGGPLGFAAALFFLRVKRSELSWRRIVVDSEPPPQQVVPETHYVSYENDEFAKAHQWACEQLARKFPGSVEMLTSLDSLIRQQLAGRRDPS